MKYYEVQRNRTCKAIGSKDFYYQWYKETLKFNTIPEVKEFLKSEYGNCKKSKMYVDDTNGQAKHVGYIFHYNTPKASYDDQPKNNQDWIKVKEIKATTVIIK